MAKFVTDRDVRYFRQLGRELIDDIQEIPIIMYKIVLADSPTNIYGESLKKTFYRGVQIMCIPQRQDKRIQSDMKTLDVNQQATFAFMRETLEEAKIYPEVGDLIFYDKSYYEVDNIKENQLIAGKPQYSYSIVCESHLTNRAPLNIEEPNR